VQPAGRPRETGSRVTQQFKAAEQQIYEAGNLIVLVVTVDAVEPEADYWHVSYLVQHAVSPLPVLGWRDVHCW